MYAIILIALSSYAVAGVAAPGGATVPWEDFKPLYREKIERELKRDERARAHSPGAVIQRADLSVAPGATGISGELRVAGVAFRKAPQLLPLVDGGVLVTEIVAQQGAVLVRDARGYAVRTAGVTAFQVSLRVRYEIESDAESSGFAFVAPHAIVNTLRVTLPQGMQLASTPGPAAADGSFALRGGDEYTVRFLQTRDDAGTDAAVVDTFSTVEVIGRRLVCRTRLYPLRVGSGALSVTLAPGSRFTGTTLRSDWARQDRSGRVSMTLPATYREPFDLRYEIDLDDKGSARFVAPSIDRNSGREGEFAIIDPVDGRLRAGGAALAANLATAQLPAHVIGDFQRLSNFARTRSPVEIVFDRYAPVEVPEVMLDNVEFLVAYTEAGQALTTLRLNVPARLKRLRLDAVPGAELWSVKVDGKPRSVYATDASDWVIGLSGGGDVQVEIAYLTHATRLGLHGKLPLNLPRTGLKARALDVVVTLPARVELLSLEGDLLAVAAADKPPPPATAIRSYAFNREYYRGDALAAAFYYREPLAAPRS